MILSKIKMNKYNNDYIEKNHLGKNFLADIDIIIDYDIIINDIKLMDGIKGKYLKFPVDDKGRSVAYPIKEEARQFILDEVLKKYKEED